MVKTDAAKKRILIFLLLFLLGLALRLFGIRFESGDWYESLSVWIEELDRGGLQALSRYSGNYNMPYVTFLLFLTYLSIGVLGLNLQKGLFMLINWLVISPENGRIFAGLIPWLKAMPAYFGYMTGTFSLILAFLKPKYCIPAAVIHVLLLLYLGTVLQKGW